MDEQVTEPAWWESLLPLIKQYAVEYGLQALGAIAVWIIGGMVVKALTRTSRKVMEKRGVDESLRPFLSGILNITLRVALVIAILGMFGIETTSFVAILGAAGLAVGMALSGTLQNFAGGVMILLFKPFKVGDVIQAQGYTGSVNSIQIFNTVLKTPDNKTVIIPNGGLSTGSMVNFSTEATRRVDWTVGIGYGDDAEKAMQVMHDMLAADERIHKDPAVFIAVSELADSSVNFAVRAWVDAGDYWGVFFDFNKKVYQEFDKHGLNIPYPQMDVHVHNQN